MPGTEDRQVRALEKIAISARELVQVFSVMNTNLVQLGKFLKERSEETPVDLDDLEENIRKLKTVRKHMDALGDPLDVLTDNGQVDRVAKELSPIGKKVRIQDEHHERFGQIGTIVADGIGWAQVVFEDGEMGTWSFNSLELLVSGKEGPE